MGMCTRVRKFRVLVVAVVLDLRGLEGDVLGLESSVGLVEHVVPIVGIVKHLLKVLYPLILALAVGPLRCTILRATPLQPKEKKVSRGWSERNG